MLMPGPPNDHIVSEITPNDLFLASEKASYRYRDLQNFEQFIHQLAEKHNISDIRPLGIRADSSDLTVFLIAACWRRGIPFVCLSPHEKPDVLHRQIGVLKPALICTASSRTDVQNDMMPDVFKQLSLKDILHDHSVADGYFLENINHDENDIFGYFFTSGTSGTPKIVPLKRRQMLAAARASAKNIRPDPNHFWLLCMPLYHVGGMSLILRSLLYGAAVYRMNTFDTQQAAQYLQNDTRFAAASLVPTMLKRLLEDDHFATHPFFQSILLGGGPISSSLLKQCIDRNIPVIPSYGMTESCAQIAANPVDHQTDDEKLQSAGKLFLPNDVDIRNEDEKSLPAGKSGHIWLEGPQIFDGYLHESNHTAFDNDGWFNTGDFGRVDEENMLYVEARRTDLIITGGENVSPFEVEDALNVLPDVEEAAVFGLRDEEWGQRVVAAVVCTSPEATSSDQLRSALKKQLPSFKIPRQFIFVDELPRTATGKIKRSKLIDFLPQ